MKLNFFKIFKIFNINKNKYNLFFLIFNFSDCNIKNNPILEKYGWYINY